jgi:hypothetical protein
MIAFVNARLSEAVDTAETDEQRRYVEAMRDIVLLWDDTAMICRAAISGGDTAEIDAAAKARWAVTCAIGFIASARRDHPDFRQEWQP